MADPLNWDEEQKQREVKHYLMRVEAERDSQTQLTDTTAEAARLGAPDIVPIPE
jgi:glycerol-3-phosphate dehydrogenase